MTMKLLQVLALLCLVTSIGYSCKIRLPDFLEDLFRNVDDGERQSSEIVASDRGVAVFTVVLLISLVANVVSIVNNRQAVLKLEIEETLINLVRLADMVIDKENELGQRGCKLAWKL